MDADGQQRTCAGIDVHTGAHGQVTGQVIWLGGDGQRFGLGIRHRPVESGILRIDVVDSLLGASVAGHRVGGPENLVTRDHVRERSTEMFDLDRAAESEGERDDVRRHRRLVLVDEPHAALGARERQDRRTGRCSRPIRDYCSGPGDVCHLDSTREITDRRGVEDVSHPYRDPEHPGDTGRESGRGQ